MSQSPNLQTEVRTGWNRINLYWFTDLLTRETQVISNHVLIVTLRLLPFFFRKYRPSSYPCLHIKFITCVQRKQELLIMYVGHSCWNTSLTMCDVIKWPTMGSGGNSALETLYRLVRVNWMLVLVNLSSCMLVEESLGQMSLSPQNGDTVMVFFSSYWGRLSEIPPSTYRLKRNRKYPWPSRWLICSL